MEMSDIEVLEVVVPLHLRENVEDRRHPIYTTSSRFGNQDGHKNIREYILSMINNRPAF
jgi:hypothetical protein